MKVNIMYGSSMRVDLPSLDDVGSSKSSSTVYGWQCGGLVLGSWLYGCNNWCNWCSGSLLRNGDLEGLERGRSSSWADLIGFWAWLGLFTFTQRVLCWLGWFCVAHAFLDVNASNDLEVSSLERLLYWFFLLNSTWAAIRLTIGDCGWVRDLGYALACGNLLVLSVGLNVWGSWEDRWGCWDSAWTVESQRWHGLQFTTSISLGEVLTHV